MLKINKLLDKTLLLIEQEREKKRIEQTRVFIPKIEFLPTPVINET